MEKTLGFKERYLSFVKAQKLQTGKQVTVAIVVNITMIVLAYYASI